jgi:hypothetical protein
MEKLLIEIKKLRTELNKFRLENEKKQKEMINYFAFQIQIQKQILNQIKFKEKENGKCDTE